MYAMRTASSVTRRLSRSSLFCEGAFRVSSVRRVASLTGGHALTQLATELPHMDAIRYEHKNVKWSFRDINYYSHALACGLLDLGLQPGDKVLSWLPNHLSEQVRRQIFEWILNISNIFLFCCPHAFPVLSLAANSMYSNLLAPCPE